MSIRSQLLHFDRAKVQPLVALRNALGVIVPLAGAIALGQPFAGLLGSLGAINAALSDGSDPFLPRGRRMMLASLLSAIAVTTGALSGAHFAASTTLIVIWALGAGLMVALGTSAADIGLLSLVMVLVFAGQPMPPERAVTSGLIAMLGGCFQTLISISLWPIQRYEPERRVIAALYAEISAMAAGPIRTSEPPRATAQINEAQSVVRALGSSHSIQGARYVSLVSQAERIRLTVIAIRDAPYFREVAAISQAIAGMVRGEPAEMNSTWFDAVQHPRLAGQLRAAAELAGSSTLAGRLAFEQRQLAQPWRLRLESAIATLRANLTVRSSAMRHALRLATAVLIGEVLAKFTGVARSYWLPMTAAIILKPDFTATFSRGLLRIAGTFAGLGLATALFHFVKPAPALEVALVFLIVFVFRAYGPGHYGILTASLTSYIVVIFALAGQPPSEVIRERAIHSVLGGVLALLVYAVWPTWERRQIREVLARMLDAYRAYFRAVHEKERDLDRIRLEGRLARSNMEAALDRFLAEPKVDQDVGTLLPKIMASSHRVVHAMMAMEAEETGGSHLFLDFAYKAEIMLHALSTALRGSPLDGNALPDLRSAQRRLADAGDLSAHNADRLTNSLNTLAEQVLLLEAARTRRLNGNSLERLTG